MKTLPESIAPPVILLDSVCFRYEQFEALHNISLRIDAGAFVIVVGPNGGGKTTLLKLILGLLQPRFGVIRVLGQPPAQVRRCIGYVPQALSFDAAFPASVSDVVLMGRVERHRFGPYRACDRQAVKDALNMVGLDDYGSRSFAALSGGERQRVLIAQALVTEPQLLLLDEPNANLDPAGAGLIYELLQELNRRLTIVMVSHNLNMVESFASHLLCVNHTAEMRCLAEVASSEEEGFWRHVQHQGSCPVNQRPDAELCACHQHTPAAEDHHA